MTFLPGGRRPATTASRPAPAISRWPFAAVGLALACSTAIADDELEDPPEVPRRSLTAEPVAKAPFVPEGPIWTLAHGIKRPLLNTTKGLVMVDRLDVGNEADERAHEYSVREPVPHIERDFLIPFENVSYREDGRAQRSAETFVVTVAPGQDNFLVKGFDTTASDQKVRVSIDGVPAGIWSAPNGSPSRYGEAIFRLRSPHVGVLSRLRVELEYVSGEPETNAFVYWVFARPAQRLAAPLRTDVADLWLTDQLDVGTELDERRHGYVIDAESFHGEHQFESPDSGQVFLENGRATRSYEAFEMAVIPGRDHLLVKAFDTFSENQVVRVLVDQKLVGEWALPDASSRYGEGAFRIPAEFIGAHREISVRIEFVSASIDSNSFHYWLFAAPPVRHG